MKDGTVKWKIIVEVSPDPVTGKRNRIYETVNGTKRQAEARLRQILQELEGQTYIDRLNTTVAEWFNEWLSVYMTPVLSPVTTQSYRQIIDGHIIPKLGNIRLQALTTTQLQRFYNEIGEASPRSGNPLSAKTVRNIHMVVQGCLRRAEKLGLIKKNPDLDVEIPKTKKYKAQVYNNEEIQQLIAHAKNTEMELPIYILLCLGLRRGELLGLKWSDIDWEGSKISICRSVAKVGNTTFEKSTKTENGERTLEMPEALLKLLKDAHRDYMRRKLKMGKDFYDSGYVICLEDGKPYSLWLFSDRFRKFIQNSGLKYIRLHDMRHTNATLMLSLGISPKVAQQRLGHSNFSTTMDLYSHVLEDVGKEAANRIEENIFAKVNG